jgi:3-oxoacyl-[acyl-carrier protein] reductase
MSLTNRSVLVTGGARGLGRHISEAFLLRGYNVAVNYSTSMSEALVIQRSAPNRAIAIHADVSNSADVTNMINQIEKLFGRLDVVINNAGIAKDNLLIRQTEEEWDRIIRTNLTGTFNVIKAAVPLMIKSGGGHIINISSYSGLKGRKGQAAYSASKAALIGLTMTTASELSGDNIRVNAIVPGYMMTEMGSNAEKAAGAAKKDALFQAFSDPQKVARSIVSVAELSYITGQVISLDSRII